MSENDVIDARSRLSDFVSDAKRTNVLGFDWDAASWAVPSKLSAAQKKYIHIHFGLMSGRRCVQSFPPDMDRFAKAMCCEKRSQRTIPYGGYSYMTLICALRLLFRCLADSSRRPVDLTIVDFDRAATMAIAEHGGTAGKIVRQLRWLAKIMTKRRLTCANIGDWREPEPVDPKTTARPVRMLSQDEVSALAHLSGRGDLSARDLLCMCAVDLLMCGGFRIGEVCTLPLDTLVREPVFKDGELLREPDGEPVWRYGLRYWPQKGGAAIVLIKAIPTAMVPVAIRAIERAKALTAKARAVARFQLENTDATTLGEPWDALPEDALLTTDEVEAALGLRDASAFLIRAGLTREASGTRLGQLSVRKSDLYAHLLKLSFRDDCRPDLSSQPVQLSDLLFVRHASPNVSGGGLPGTAVPLLVQTIQTFLRSKSSARSIFERLGYLVGGKPISITTHQPRHYINTLAMRHGLSPMDLARWMGRFNVAANAAYERRDERELAEELRAKLVEAGVLTESELPYPVPWTETDAFKTAKVTAHATPFGMCEHDLAEMPCASHAAMDLTAPSIMDARQRKVLVARTRRLLSLAKAARDRGAWGADVWVDAHQSFLEGIERPKC